MLKIVKIHGQPEHEHGRENGQHQVRERRCCGDMDPFRANGRKRRAHRQQQREAWHPANGQMTGADQRNAEHRQGDALERTQHERDGRERQ
jgi:hypothetical protein